MSTEASEGERLLLAMLREMVVDVWRIDEDAGELIELEREVLLDRRARSMEKSRMKRRAYEMAIERSVRGGWLCSRVYDLCKTMEMMLNDDGRY